MDLEVTGTKEIDGKDAFVLHATTCSLWAQPYSVDGADVAEAYVGSTKAWLRMLDGPVADGHTWTTTNGAATFDMTYHELGALETDAGSFDDCWQVEQEVGYTQTRTYCRGVGLVAETMVDLAGGKVAWTLTSKNF